MGLSMLGNPVFVALEAVTNPNEKQRRAKAKRRTKLYRDDYEQILYAEVNSIFQNQSVRDRFYPLMRMAGANSFLKRISDEVARPIYATPPRRKLKRAGAPEPDKEQAQRFAGLAAEMNLDRQMDLACRLLIAGNAVIIFCRYVQDLGMCLDILTPDMVTVVPDPRNPLRALAVIYDIDVWTPLGKVVHWVVWDDEQYFELDTNGGVFHGPVKHDYGRLPMTEVHRRGRWGCYWDETTGSDLEAAAVQSMMLNAMALKLHKGQGHKQLAFVGESNGFSKDQTLDEESVLIANGQGSIQSIDLQGDPSYFLKTKETVEVTVAANYGVSRDRLNQKSSAESPDDGLKERTAELVQVMRAAELDLFEVVKIISREHPTLRLDADLEMAIDYGAFLNRVDRKTQLEIRQIERSMGVRSILDDVKEDNPDIVDDEGAWEEVRENMEAEALYVLARRALNIPADASAEEPGQNPAENGAMGPKVRDGEMSRDQAAEQANTGPAGDAPSEPNLYQ